MIFKLAIYASHAKKKKHNENLNKTSNHLMNSYSILYISSIQFYKENNNFYQYLKQLYQPLKANCRGSIT